MAEGGGDKPIYWYLMSEEERKAYREKQKADAEEVDKIAREREERCKSRSR